MLELDTIFGWLVPRPYKPNRGSAKSPWPCCDKADEKSARVCHVCRGATCNQCHGFFNGHWICGPCRDHIKAELERERAEFSHFPLALAGGLIAACVSATLWCWLAIKSGMVVGFAAILVGYLSGLGAHLMSGKRRGAPVQWAAVPCAALGIVLGHYAISFYFYKVQLAYIDRAAAEAVTFADPAVVGYFCDHYGFLTPFDAITLSVAMGAALILPMQRTAAVR
ncbi:MAG: hypothetical protein HY291_03220 [Planctomycetes bacterium]|nr:hypothetical protein [Planctomycetota bacterium]